MKLASCPFCGGEAEQSEWSRQWPRSIMYQVMCKDCGAIIEHETEEQAIAAWNRRAEPKPTKYWCPRCEVMTERGDVYKGVPQCPICDFDLFYEEHSTDEKCPDCDIEWAKGRYSECPYCRE